MCRTQCALAVVVLYVGLAQSWDIAVSYGDVLEFYNNNIKSETVRFESQNLAALAYDEVHNMMLYVDKQSDNDAICGYDISSNQTKHVIERNGRNIRGLAFDPATELLFFTDTNERSINWISLKPGSMNNVHGNVVIKMDDGIPTDIAVDSCRGYIYWINTNLTRPTIERARFDGAEREVVIHLSSLSVNKNYKLEPHSLAIDQQTQRMFWFEARSTLKYYIHSADLNGKSRNVIIYYTVTSDGTVFSNLSNTFTVSKSHLYMVGWNRKANVWEYPKTLIYDVNYNPVFTLNNKTPAGIAANYKLKDQIQGIQDCRAPTSLVLNNFVTVGPFCVHGMKVDGQSHCECTPGYTGERCDVSVCENYCFQGNCSFNDDGHPKCSCNVGYYGERCEVNACNGFCLNNGVCSLNEHNKPVCQCMEDYAGDRCDVSHCLYYCIQGNCSYNDDSYPQCSCNAGYSGERCDVSPCSVGSYLNNSVCSLNVGDSCDLADCQNYCLQGNCSTNDGIPQCSCDAGYTGERCEVNACSGYCLNNGDCFLNEKGEPVCQCTEGYVGDRCDVSHCVNYCFQGNCSFNDTGLPQCSCNAGFSGERCEVNACEGYCLNNGVCSLNEEDEPVCQCGGDNEGSRCEAAKNDTSTNTPTRAYYSAERTLTLADIFSNWRKPVTKMTVILESS